VGYETICINNHVEQLSVKTGKKAKDKVLCNVNLLCNICLIIFNLRNLVVIYCFTVAHKKIVHNENVIGLMIWLLVGCDSENAS